MTKKLIEVALPLAAINEACAREKSIRHGHPSTLHLWWARRPLAAARAVLFSQLVDDPSAHPELFPTPEEQDKERQRLFKIIEDLVIWENSNNTKILNKARAEIKKSVGTEDLSFLDPFAGGGAIPLEAQRLGLKSHAGDLNPVAVMINKAMIEIPPKFADVQPINPNSSKHSIKTKGTEGLTADVAYYGKMMRDEAFNRVGHLYPQVDLPKEYGGQKATVIAWIWARTVKCSNPLCGCEMPLVRSFDLSTKKNHEAHIEVNFENKKAIYTVHSGKSKKDGTVNRKGAVCPCCGASVDFPYIREEGKAHRLGQHLMAVVAEGKNGRIYLNGKPFDIATANIERPDNVPDAQITKNPRDFKTPNYGLTHFSDLFTNRQLTTLTTFVDVLKDLRKTIETDAVKAGMSNDGIGLAEDGNGAKAYAEAISVYLGFVIDKLADYNSSISSWSQSRDGIRNTFGRQAIPMVWDFAEANPFSNSSGCFDNMLDWVVKCFDGLGFGSVGAARQADAAQDYGLRDIVVSTDPPYYDNIGYADLSDFFYIWMRESLKDVYPDIFRTMLVPKVEELVATPYRFAGGKEEAKSFFENGMLQTFKQINTYALDEIPVTIYYAFKQSETDEKDDEKISSSGWETMLSAIIKAGFSITGTWPMRTEMVNRTVASGTNALASSIVLVARKRPLDAPVCTRQNFIKTLRRELKQALEKLQSSNLAPVDLAQSAIGPGIGVYSRYSKVLESDGSEMSVRSALQIINQELDVFFTEQDGDLDKESRFCVDLYSQAAFNDIKFGDADILARAKNTSVAMLAQKGLLSSKAGVVRLLERDELTNTLRIDSPIWLVTQVLTAVLDKGGIEECAKTARTISTSVDIENAKSLAYRLFTIADKKGWTQEAYAYNTLVNAWNDVQERMYKLSKESGKQLDLI